MAIKESSQACIARALGREIASWQVFGVYEYAWACRTCACGHSIAKTYVLVRKGDHGPAFGEMVEIGSECIKYVGKISPDLYTWLMGAKAEMERTQRRMRKARIEALREDPAFRVIARQLDQFRADQSDR